MKRMIKIKKTGYKHKNIFTMRNGIGKRLLIVSCLCMMLSAFSSCGGSNEPAPAPPQSPKPPVEQVPGDYKLTSGNDILAILDSISANIKINRKSNVEIAPAPMVMYNDLQTDGLGRLLTFGSDSNVTITGTPTIVADKSRIILPYSVVVALHKIGGKISQKSGAPEFHVPTFSDIEMLKSVFDGYVHFTTNRSNDFDYVETAIPDSIIFTKENNLIANTKKLPRRTDGSFYYIVTNNIPVYNVSFGDYLDFMEFDRIDISHDQSPDIKMIGTLIFREINTTVYGVCESVLRHIAAMESTFTKDTKLKPTGLKNGRISVLSTESNVPSLDRGPDIRFNTYDERSQVKAVDIIPILNQFDQRTGKEMLTMVTLRSFLYAYSAWILRPPELRAVDPDINLDRICIVVPDYIVPNNIDLMKNPRGTEQDNFRTDMINFLGTNLIRTYHPNPGIIGMHIPMYVIKESDAKKMGKVPSDVPFGGNWTNTDKIKLKPYNDSEQFNVNLKHFSSQNQS